MNMIRNNELKYIQSFAHKKHWIQESVFIIEGPKLVEEAIKAGWTIDKIYATKQWEGHLGHSGGEIEVIDEVMLSRLSQLQTPNQVIALVQKKTSYEPITYHDNFTLILDGIQDPGNLGTIIRTADWFGIKNILVTADTASSYNPKVIQSTMGSCFRVLVQVVDVEAVLEEAGLPVMGTLLNGNSVYTHKMAKSGFLVIGNESKGIREKLQPYITQAVTIPSFGAVESLNAAVATGIILSHWKMNG